MTGMTIITGATGSLGLECARALAARAPDARLLFAVRDPARGEAAIAELGLQDRAGADALDLASLASVTAFVARHRAESIDAIVCNAGMQLAGDEPRLSVDGIELTFAVNHLGHFALVDGLLGALAPGARIMVVASDTHDPRKFTGMPHPAYTTCERLAHPAQGETVSGRRRYTTSKLCNVLYAYELARRLAGDERRITVNAFNPGLMPGTGLARDASAFQQLVWDRFLPRLTFLPFVRTPQQSGADLARLTAEETATGAYFDGPRAIRSSRQSYDEETARELWSGSEQLLAAASPGDGQ
jgi:NAD(P)-dependent dehydrogenase (short-subunit alcohol dehydrogenase family)